MGNLDNNDTFTPFFKEMVDKVKESDEMDAVTQNFKNGTNNPVKMDEDFKEEVLTVVNVIKTCEDNSKKIDWAQLIASFFVSGVGLYMTNVAIASGQLGAGLVTGGISLTILILSIMDTVKERKRAAKDAAEVRVASGLDDATLKVVLQQLAQEGNIAAQNYYNYYFKPQENKGMTL